jgi:hypothetical protein
MKTLVIISGIMMLMGIELQTPELEGAWSSQDSNGQQQVIILANGHYALSTYNAGAKTFESTRGGKFRIDGKKLIEIVEFNTADPQQTGTEQSSFTIEKKGKQHILKTNGSTFARLDDGTPGKLAGAWVITGRMTPNGPRRNTPGARRTMKILSGTRFQWIAYNVETKEFFGTGGGTYTTTDGKYTENIEFFSRDSSRVGASLSFDYGIEGKDWRHKGLSSKGDPLDEFWTRRSDIGL